METFFTSGHAADFILAVLAVEGCWLIRRGHGVGDVALLLLPAALIVIGLRAALVGAAWPWIAAPLALSFPVHIIDLTGRLRRPGRSVPTDG